MKLLIVTQAMDLDHPILGFFHRWVEEFAAQGAQVTVIAQQVGRTALPATVRVETLGKERGRHRFFQILTFWRLIVARRGEYDAVLVHMTPVWVLLGAPLWGLFGRPVFLWYEVRRGGRLLWSAERLVRRIFSATPDGMPWPSVKQEVVGHGIDIEQFKPGPARDPTLIVCIGRVTPIKHFPLIVEAFATLPGAMRLRIVGDAFTPTDAAEKERVFATADRTGVRARLELGFLPHRELPELLARATLSLHAARGGLDKALLEAMAAGCPVISTSEAAAAVLPPVCRATPASLAAQALATLTLTEPEREALSAEVRSIVVKNHSLPRLVTALLLSMSRG